MKNKKYCPLCMAKKIIGKTKVSQVAKGAYGNGVAMTPPMGWSSWNLFRNKISEDLIKEIADAMVDSGLAEAGYIYVNIDDCWQANERDEKGRLQCDKVNFPSGIRALTDYVNSRGVKLGIYSSNGTLTCEDYPASLRHERVDAETFAEWGVEYFKYDFCHNVPIPSKAPWIIGVGFAKEGAGENFAYYTSKDMKLGGDAYVVDDEKVEPKTHVEGLDCGLGNITVEVEAPEAGEYILYLSVRKDDRKKKFLRAMVNGKDEYHLYCQCRDAGNNDSKLQTIITLEKGKNTVVFDNPIKSRMDSAAIQYKLMGRELKRATKLYAEKNGTEEKPIIFSICEWGFNQPWKWGAEAGNLWRTTGDIMEKWPSILALYEFTVNLYKYSAPGAWNDPDMLEVGNGDLTQEENKSHFSLWCMMNAPLILGNDIRKFILPDGSIDKENAVYKILTNKDMIAINQDPLGIQCRRFKTGLVDVLVKPLIDNSVAICVFNKTNKVNGTEFKLKDIANLGYVSLPKKEGYEVYDVWDNKYSSGTTMISSAPEAHGVKVYIVK